MHLVTALIALTLAAPAPPAPLKLEGPPPTLAVVRVGTAPETVEVGQVVTRLVPKTVTEMVPVTVLVLVDGRAVEKTEYREVTRTVLGEERTLEFVAHAVKDVEFYNLKWQ